MLKDVANGIRTPSVDCRGVPFWAWNSKLEIPELRRQIRILKEMGMGGFFMHSRVGLNTPYLNASGSSASARASTKRKSRA